MAKLTTFQWQIMARVIVNDSLYDKLRNEWVSMHASGVLDVALFRWGNKVPFLPLSVALVFTDFKKPTEQPGGAEGTHA